MTGTFFKCFNTYFMCTSLQDDTKVNSQKKKIFLIIEAASVV